MGVRDRISGAAKGIANPEDLRQRRPRESGEGSARDLQDPHEWDDPDPSWRERLIPSTRAGQLAWVAVVIIVASVVSYLYPIISATHGDWRVLVVGAVLAIVVGSYLRGRQDGVDAYKEMDKSIINYGNDVDVRLGKEHGMEGSERLFVPFRNLSYGAFSFRVVKKRDLPFAADKLRSKGGGDGEDTGEAAVVDRLNPTTVETDTDTVGRVFVTNAADMEYDEYGQHSDRYTTLPHTIDVETAEDLRQMLMELQTEIDQLEKRIGLLRESNEELQDLRDSLTIPQLEQMQDIVGSMMEELPAHGTAAAKTNGTSASENGAPSWITDDYGEEGDA